MNSFANFMDQNYGNAPAAAIQFAYALDAPDALNSAVVAAKLEGIYFEHLEIERISVSLNQKRDAKKRSGWSR